MIKKYFDHALTLVKLAVEENNKLFKDEPSHKYYLLTLTYDEGSIEIKPQYDTQLHSPEDYFQIAQACGANSYITLSTNQAGDIVPCIIIF